jgi:hypothetical protein
MQQNNGIHKIKIFIGTVAYFLIELMYFKIVKKCSLVIYYLKHIQVYIGPKDLILKMLMFYLILINIWV